MKKLLTLVKIIIPIFIMFICTNVNATTITVDTTKPGTTDPDSYYVTNQAALKIENNNDLMVGYKILDIYYNSNTNIFTYEFTDDFQGFLNQSTTYKDLTIEDYYQLTSGDITSGSTHTTSTLDKLVSVYAEYVKKNNIEGYEYIYTSPETLDVGSYLVLQKYLHPTGIIYAVMVGNLIFEADGTDWILNDVTIKAKSSYYGGSFWIQDFEYKNKTYVIGREFEFISELLVPNYPTNATNKSFIVENIFDEGITFQGLDKLTMTIGENSYIPDETGTVKDIDNNTIATITFIEQVLTINFNTDYIYTNKVIVRYKAKLNNDAKIGPDGNSVEQRMHYTTDPYDVSTSSTVGNTATAYTYDLAILKYDEDDDSKLLNGAVFEIYSDENLTDLVGTVTTGTEEDGIGLFHGLAQGTYYIKEVKAPTGYKLIRDIIVYELDADQNEDIVTPAALIDELPEGTFLLEIPNEKITFLPVTGGIGTVIYTLTGLIIVGLSFYYIKIYKKRQTNS